MEKFPNVVKHCFNTQKQHQQHTTTRRNNNQLIEEEMKKAEIAKKVSDNLIKKISRNRGYNSVRMQINAELMKGTCDKQMLINSESFKRL